MVHHLPQYIKAPPGLEPNDPWQRKRLTPHQLLVHDVRLEQWRPSAEPRLELRERVARDIVPTSAVHTPSLKLIRASNAARNPIERQRLIGLEEEYGWMSNLRIRRTQDSFSDADDTAKLRWVHISSRFSEYLPGVLWAMSDAQDVSETAEAVRILDRQIQSNERYSKHGKYFEPFWSSLGPQEQPRSACPAFLAVNFVDWSVNGSTPPLRFQIDKREGYGSSRSSSHLLRSVLQHFYRLEDTADREKGQVFNKYKPWKADRDLDLRVRRWYGHYPTSLSVDELWMLVIDDKHIVTFSSNQSWKSRSPPLQLAARISDVSFRATRNEYFTTNDRHIYTTLNHSIVCLAGAVGMLNRSFLTDSVLPLSERFAGYLGHLQYRIYHAPSTKLVIDLMQVQEELHIIVQTMQRQLDIIQSYGGFLHEVTLHTTSGVSGEGTKSQHLPDYASVTDSVERLSNNLQIELNDIQALLENTKNLVTRAVQLVNLRQEDHSVAVLVFTIITVVFLPLNFVCSFFGMNVHGISSQQSIFWIWAVCLTLVVVSVSIFIAFNGGAITERFVLWKEKRRHKQRQSIMPDSAKLDTGFHVLNASQGRYYSDREYLADL